MRNSVSTMSVVAASAAAAVLLSVPLTESGANERSAPSAASSHTFREALASGASVSTLDYSDPGPNCAHDPAGCNGVPG